MFMQTHHGHPIVGGHTSRLDPRNREGLASTKFLASLLAEDKAQPTQPYALPDAATAALYRQELNERNIGTVILNPGFVLSEDGAEPPERPGETEVRAGSLLTPIWYGSLARGLMRPPIDAPFETRMPRKPWMHASVIPYLEAVLGSPTGTLEDGSRVWTLDE